MEHDDDCECAGGEQRQSQLNDVGERRGEEQLQTLAAVTGCRKNEAQL